LSPLRRRSDWSDGRPGNDCCCRDQLAQQTDPLTAEFDVKRGDARQISAGAVQARNEPVSTGSAPVQKTIGIVRVAALAAATGGVG
jgi:hypothetical protein